MKTILAAFLAVAFLASSPVFAGEDKGDKSAEKKKDDKKKDDKKKDEGAKSGGGGW